MCACFQAKFVSWAVGVWNCTLQDADYKQATRKWLVRQGHGSVSGGIVHAFEQQAIATEERAALPPHDWLAELRSMAATTELQEFIARVETAAAAKEAASMAMLPPTPDRSGMLRRLSSKVSESVSASPSPRTRRESQILGVGQQLFQVKQTCTTDIYIQNECCGCAYISPGVFKACTTDICCFR
eukprot:COSAG05_NODE_764_length_7477_cov_18.431553_2_plen_185_part_00